MCALHEVINSLMFCILLLKDDVYLKILQQCTYLPEWDTCHMGYILYLYKTGETKRLRNQVHFIHVDSFKNYFPQHSCCYVAHLARHL